MKKLAAIVTITLGLFCLLATSQQAAAGVHVYVLVEETSSDSSDLSTKIGGVSLSNCKQLVKSLFRNDLLVWIACNEVKDISPAISKLISGVEEIERWSVWVIESD